jgi:hypothetical protein
VNTRADALRKRLGKTDRAKLDEYFNSVRDVEQRIAGDTCGTGGSGGDVHDSRRAQPDVTASPSRATGPAVGLIALAFQCDITRVATFMYEHSFSDCALVRLHQGVTRGHHSITHLTTARGLVQEEKINLFYIDRFAYLLGKLKA